MSNASVTCNLAYSLVSSPPWRNNCDIELILSDIPFISVGLLAFGVSAFFLAIRRFTFSIVSLYFSVLLSFTAVIIDLSQILIRDLSHVTIWPLLTTREILLALSLSLRFIFYWLYATEPPIEEQRPHSFQAERSHFLSLNPQDELHSGSWARWGVAGSYAKFALLATIPAITALQIIWRVFQRYHDYSAVYAADATLEVVVSVLLLLKLLSNIVPTSSIPRAHTFRECGFPALALIFDIGISFGGLVSFAFTESIVGRLLQGVELYILIVFMTIYPFFRHKEVTTVPNTRDLTMRKVELPEQLRASTFRLSAPVVSTPRLSTTPSSGIQGRSIHTDAARHSALDSIGRAPPWVPWRVSRIQSNQDEDRAKLWDQGEVENGPPDAGQGSAGHHSMVSATSAMDEESTSWRDIVNDSVPYSLRTTTPDSLSVSTTGRSKDGSLNSGHIWDAIRVGIPRQLSFQPLSLVATPVTAINESGAAPPDPPSQDSPICELDGVTSQSPLGRERSSGTSLDQFRELQSELDKTIAALRQFSPSSPISPTSTSSPRCDSNDDEKIPSAVRQSSSTDRQSFSTYGTRTLSDFSLSNFPSPPSPPQVPSLLPLHNRRLKEDRRARLGSCQDTSSDILTLTPPPRIPAALTDVPSSPHSDLTSDSPYQGNGALPTAAGRPSRFNSGGMQYEITSFIDGLTTPVGSMGPMNDMSLDELEENYPLDFAGIIEDSNSQEASPSLSIATLRPSPLRTTALTGLPSSSTRHRLSAFSMQGKPSLVSKSEEQPSDPVEPVVQRGMRPLILPSMTIAPSLSHSRSSSISSGGQRSRRMFGLPPRPDFRVPKPVPEDVQASGAFRRLKPPPLILLSDDEYFAKHSE